MREMHTCVACNKMYTSRQNLRKHLTRQPLCERWAEMQPGLRSFVDDRFMFPMTDAERESSKTRCFICGTQFVNAGNLTRHLESSVICSKWALYKDLEPLATYLGGGGCGASVVGAADDQYDGPYERVAQKTGGGGRTMQEQEPIHIIWNVFLVDKPFVTCRSEEELLKVLKLLNVSYIIAILPDEAEYARIFPASVVSAIDKHVLTYDGHNTSIDVEAYDAQCLKIEEHRGEKGALDRRNVLVFCNSGYQRSIPFLCYYLLKHHANEVPTVDRAIDIILPQVDKEHYAANRAPYIASVQSLLVGSLLPTPHAP